MNEQPQRQTFFGGCPHDCPDTCAMIYEVEDGKLVEVRGNKEHPMTRGGLCVKLKDYHDHHYNPDRVLYPLRRVGPEGLAPIRAHLLGRGHRRDHARAGRRSSREHGTQAIMPYSYLGNEGLVQGLTAGDAFFNCLGSTVNEKTFCASGSSTAWLLTVGPTGGVDPESFVHSRYIVIWACNSISTNLHHWPFVLEAQKRGAKVVVIDSLPLAHGQAGRLAHHAEARHRRRARHGHHRRADRERPCRPGLGREAHGRLPRACRARGRVHAGLCGACDGRTGARHRQVRARVRHHPAFGHPHGRGARAACRRRPDHPRGLRNPGACRLMAPCRRRVVADAAVGVPGRLGARVAARFHSPRHARGQQSPARPRARRRHEARSADHGPLRLQHQSGEPGARDQHDRARAQPRGSVLRDGGAFRHRYRRLRRHRPAGHHGRRARRHDVLVGAFLSHHQREGDRALRRGEVECRDLPPARGGDGLRRSAIQDERHGARRALRPMGRAADGGRRHGVFPARTAISISPSARPTTGCRMRTATSRRRRARSSSWSRTPRTSSRRRFA